MIGLGEKEEEGGGFKKRQNTQETKWKIGLHY